MSKESRHCLRQLQVPVVMNPNPQTVVGDQAHGGRTLQQLEREIERLNGECLELEEQSWITQDGGWEAWTSYQRAQEKAAALEATLQEEVNSLNKAWTQDKQQFLAQATQLREDCETSDKNMREAQRRA